MCDLNKVKGMCGIMEKHSLKKYLILFLFVFVASFLYKVFVLPICGDEIWVYGFSYNISKGMIVYRDFNTMITPLYFFISSGFIKIFGNYLVSVHIFDCICIGFLMLMLYKTVGLYKSILIYPIIIYDYFLCYNYFCMFLLFIIIYFLDYKKEDNFDVFSFIAGLMFITKQSIGLFMLFPLLFYSKKKFRSLVIYLIPFLMVSIYLVINGAFYDFINYCFLGMFDFNDNNKYFSIFLGFEVLSCCYLLYKIIESKFKDEKYLFILFFQINTYPIFDAQHFIVAFIPVLYCLVKNFDISCLRPYYRFLLMSTFYIIFIIYIFKVIFVMDYASSSSKDKFLYLRNNQGNETIIKLESEVVKNYYDLYDYKFFISGNSYMIKLYNNISIGEYDLLLNGNMGYRGDDRVIGEVSDICSKSSCVFFFV